MDHEKAVVSEKLDDCFILQRVIVSLGYHSEHLKTHAGAAIGLNHILVLVFFVTPDAYGSIDYLLLKYHPFFFTKLRGEAGLPVQRKISSCKQENVWIS